MIKTIYVRLMNEDIEVWRPVLAVPQREGYMIIPQKYDTTIEEWEFVPNQQVKVNLIKRDDDTFLGAVEGL